MSSIKKLKLMTGAIYLRQGGSVKAVKSCRLES